MSENDKHCIVGFTRSDGARVVRGSEPFQCSQCGSEVWLAPSGQAMVTAGALVLCMDCALERQPADIRLAPGAAEEFASEMLRDLRN